MGSNGGRDGASYLRAKQRLKSMGVPCWLCGRPIDPDLRFPHPWSFSIDHAIPLKHGGEVLDPDNLRAAHLRCNQRKGTRIGRHRDASVPLRTSEQW